MIADGDEIVVGRYRLTFLEVLPNTVAATPAEAEA
jgi:hypothetical protein